MKKIYVILMHTNTIPSRLIRFATKYKYSHVAIALEKDCNIIYSFGRKKLDSILDSGFTAEYKNGEFFHKFNNTICKIYEIEIGDQQYENVKKIIDNMKLNINNYKYDFFGIIPRFFGIPITIKNRYVCSYFVASVLEKAKIYKFDKDTCMIKPRDFENLRGFNEIYTGSYNLY